MKKHSTPADEVEREIGAHAAATELGQAALLHAAIELERKPWVTFSSEPNNRDALIEFVEHLADDPASGLRKGGEDYVELKADGIRRYVVYHGYDTEKHDMVERDWVDVTGVHEFARWTLNRQSATIIQNALRSEGFQVIPDPKYLGVFHAALPSDKVAAVEIKKHRREGL